MSNKSKSQDQQLILYRYKKTHLIKQCSKNVQMWEIENVFTKQKAQLKIQKIADTSDQNILQQSAILICMQGHVGFPFLIWSGSQRKTLMIISQQLGPNLQTLMNSLPQKHFSLKTVCMIGIQLIKLIEDFHGSQFIHRQIHTQSLYIGKKQRNHMLILSDLQNSKVYKNNNIYRLANQNQSKQQNIKITMFTTHNQLKSGSSFKRDDIESIILVLIYLLKGSLPWDNIFLKYQSQQIKKIKLMQSIRKNQQTICEGIPLQFREMFNRARSLEVRQQPPYIWFLSQLQLIMNRNYWELDYIYDWVSNKQCIEKLRLNKNLPTLHLQNQTSILSKVYQPFEKDIGIQQIFQRQITQTKQSIHSAKTIASQNNISQLQLQSNQCIIM